MIPNLRERVHARVSPRDLPFRFRGLEPTRTEALADAVIGFSMTLMVVSLDVPSDSAQLFTAMRGFVTFALTFFTLFSVWFAHNRFCRRYGLDDDRTTWLTAGVLFIVVFYAYPLKFVVSWLVDKHVGLPGPAVGPLDMLWVVSLYGAGFAALATLFGTLHHHALRLTDVLELDANERLETQLQVRTWFGSLFACVPMMLGPVMLAFPRRSTPWRVAAIGFLVLLVAGFLVYCVRLHRIGQERQRARKALDAAAKGPLS